MFLGRVVGEVWATRKAADLSGLRLLVVQALDEVAPGIVHVGGRTDPGSTLTVDGTPVRVQPDGSFSEYVKRAAPGDIVVRATGKDGQFTERALALSKK